MFVVCRVGNNTMTVTKKSENTGYKNCDRIVIVEGDMKLLNAG